MRAASVRHSRLGMVLRTALLLWPACSSMRAATLPVPCAASACANGSFGATNFVSAGKATAVQAGPKMTVDQLTQAVTLNWRSFNISADGTVQFVQPGATAVALNQISDANPTQILGALTANGRVFLINQNGIIFGSGARVNVGGLLASTLNINPAAVANGLIAPGSLGEPAFQSFASGTSGNVAVNAGAALQTSAGGQILIFAPQVSNQGTISTPGGQTMLAAGSTIYLASSSDPSLRGLLVEIGGTGGTVTNGASTDSSVSSPLQLIGQITAKNGNVTLAGLAVNQLGRVSATTSINANGSIYLQAGDNGSMAASGASGVSGTPVPGSGGQLTLGGRSDTEVTLDSADPSTTVDSVPQLKSAINMSGAQIDILADSLARATSGSIDIRAAQFAGEAPSSASDGSRVYLAPGAELDVSGASVVLPASSNVIPVKLEGTELANSPLQRNGPLLGQTVYVDIRYGTPLANVSGEIADIGRTVTERNLTGGTISIQSHGDVILAPDSRVDLAGGGIQYTAGYLDTSELLTSTGQLVNIASANPNVLYSGIANSVTTGDAKWGVSNTYTVLPGTYQPGYVEGKDAGTLSLSAPQFVLDAAVSAGTVTGIYQRLPDQTVANGSLYRPYDQVPQAAMLIIGSPVSAAQGDEFVVDSVVVAPNLVLPDLRNPDGSAFDPLVNPLPASYTSSVLRPALFGSQGFGNVSIYTDGEYLQPAGMALDLPPGGSFAVSANAVNIQGNIDAPGGAISATAVPTAVAGPVDFALTLGPRAALNVSGEWINDNPSLYPNGNTAPLFINGGSVSLTALSGDFHYSPGVQLAAGSLIDVSGGGRLETNGTVSAGAAGSISIGAETFAGTLAGAPPRLELGATLRGYGLDDGGSLSLTDGSVCIAAASCSGGDPAVLWVSPAMLASGGFSSYALTADAGGLSVAPGTQILLRQQNLVLPGNFGHLSDLGTLIGEAIPQVLSDQVRQPVNLSLTQSVPPSEVTALGSTLLDVSGTTPSLTVGAGALIQGDPLATISLTSNVRILVDGILRAPGGSISLGLGSGLAESSYSATQAIWLGSNGVLDVSGTAQIFPNSLGEPAGSVLAGGTVSLNARRGFIELLPGSLIDVAGASGLVDEIAVGGGAPRPAHVASAGGAVQLTAAEGAALSGTFEAAAGVAGLDLEQPAGGIFSLTLDGSNRNDYAVGFGGASTFPGGARQIIVSASQPPIVVEPGYAVPDALAGYAYVSAGALKTSGFDRVSLRAVPLPTPPAPNGAGIVPGSIDFVGNVTLSAGEILSLDAASYSVSPGGLAQVRAPYVEFGNSDQTYNVVPAATTGSGTLEVSGGFIELYGSSALEGIGMARFESGGDLRLRGLLDLSNGSATTFNGALDLAGTLELTAQQIYPSTLSQFVLSADPTSVTSPTSGSILIGGRPGADQALLSAGGSLILSASTVTQAGVLRAPFGTIGIDAQSIQLEPGSLTSTSAGALTVPFGTTQGGLDWVYPLQNGNNVVYGTGGLAPPAQRVTLDGSQINVHAGAVIDVSGGGDLEAYEWIAGTGGTNDVLSNLSTNGGRPNQFAILPGLAANVAPYDPNISAGSTLQPGDAVYLSGLPGLPAGVYQLLPSRYALLPGAFLVSQVSGYQDIGSGQSFGVLGGGTIVSGYFTMAGTSFGDSRTSGFDVVPASVVLQQAQYTTTSANRFFAAQAASAGTSTPRLPQDAGVLALIASEGLTLNGTLRTAAPSGGLGAEVDISSADILVVGKSTAPSESGQIVLTAASLDALGAQTLLLGGLSEDQAVTTTAQSIEVAAGAAVSAPQLLLTALNQINVDGGTSLSATGSAPPAGTFELSGDGAFLAVSSGAQSSVTRTGVTGTTGVLTLAPGSVLRAGAGSVYLDATQNLVNAGTLVVAGGNLALQAPAIDIGAAPPGSSGAVLGQNVLGGALGSLLLESGSTVNLYGTVSAATRNLTIDGAGLLGYGGPGDAATLSASGTLTLLNSQGIATTATGSGSGRLTLSGGNIVFGGGSLGASGFDSVSLDAPHAVTAAADASFSVSSSGSAAGDLSVTASRITTGPGVQLSLAAPGTVSLRKPSGPASPAAADSSLGGELSVTGGSVDVATSLVLPSGRVILTATGGASAADLSIESTGAIDVAGTVQNFDGVKVGSPGGLVALASAGDMSLASGSIDVSAGSGGAGGSLTVSAPTGTVALGASLSGGGAPGSGASFSIDAQGFGNFEALNQALNAGGFTGSRSVRLRGPGDLIVAAGAANAVTAQNVSLEADQGRIVVDGLIDAAGSQGGSVTLASSADLVVSGTIDAHATRAGGAGGTVALETINGPMLLADGAVIDVAGGGSGANGLAGTGGTVLLRVPRGVVTQVFNGGSGVALDAGIVGSRSTTLEPFSVYANTTGTINPADLQPGGSIYNDVAAFMSTVTPAATAMLGPLAAGANFVVQPGVEIDATVMSNGTGTLELPAGEPLSLYGSRFGPGNVPGVLTLRAQNGITLDDSLSDGFAATSGAGAFTLPPATPSPDSWSYRVVAGADFTAANPLTVNAANPAAVTIGPGTGTAGSSNYAPTMLRTGDGFIDISASGDLILGNQESVIYTAGVANIAGIPLQGRGSLQGLAYPTNGGNIDINVYGDILGAPTDQFVNAWLWRVGAPTSSPTGSATAWTVDFQSFQQGVGALAGGNLTVSAGGDIDNFSASIPSIGVQLGGQTQASSLVQVQGGGQLTVDAGGSILGGSYYVGVGSASLRAGDAVGTSAMGPGGSPGLAPIVGLGDADVSITARGGLELAEIVNPTLLNRGTSQGAGSQVVFFSTYGPTSSVSLTSVAGDVALEDDNSSVASALSPSFLGGRVTDIFNSVAPLDILPPVLNVYALNGDIDVGRVLALSPSTGGNLQLLANQNIVALSNGSGSAGQLIISDADPSQLPTPAAPQTTVQIYDDIVNAFSATPDQHAGTPVHESADQAGQLVPARFVALNGSIEFQPSAEGTNGIWSAVPVQLQAGLDVVDLNLVAQNLGPGDVTSVTAGRDIIYPEQRGPTGSLVADTNGIFVDGPGGLQVTAGRNVDLGTSSGIITRANLVNPVLASTGADISVEAGIGSATPQYASFIRQYIDDSSQFDSELVAFVTAISGGTAPTADQAKTQFDRMTPQLQRTFIEALFFDLLRISGSAAAASGNGDFGGAFAAIQALFPGANAAPGARVGNPYAGDINLYFSQIYTDQGGDISLLAPGGAIDVGLALAPTSFGLSKLPDQLGVVAETSGNVSAFSYGNFLVDQSRVFAADGGDILVWSTEGNIDAGAGAKTSISAPEVNIAYDSNGQPTITLRSAIAGSGIQALAATPGVAPGSVYLFAPHGVVNANQAGIVAGNLTVAATAVLGTNNISVSGTTVGVPVPVTGLGASFAGASSAAGAAANAAEAVSGEGAAGRASSTPAAEAAVSWLDVFVTGLGEANCAPEDTECLKREQSSQHPQ